MRDKKKRKKRCAKQRRGIGGKKSKLRYSIALQAHFSNKEKGVGEWVKGSNKGGREKKDGRKGGKLDC